MIAVYTALFGNYDTVLEPRFDSVPFVLFTDQDIKSPGWDVRRVKRPHPDTRYASRYYFDQSHLAMPGCEYTIMHGANAVLTMAPGKIIEFLPSSLDIIACFAHPHRQNVYEESVACIRWHKDDATVVEGQMKRYEREGFRRARDIKLSACTLLVRRNTPRLREFEAMWWEEVKAGSCRDQLSFDYCRWKLGIDVAYIPGDLYRRGDIIKFEKHRGR